MDALVSRARDSSFVVYARTATTGAVAGAVDGFRRTTRSRRTRARTPTPSVPARAISVSARTRNARVTHRDSTMATSLPPSMAYSPSNSTSFTRASSTRSSHSNRASSRRAFFVSPRRSSCACTMAFTAARSSGTKGTNISIAPTTLSVSSRSSQPSLVHFSNNPSFSLRCNAVSSSPVGAPPPAAEASCTSMNPIFASNTNIDRPNVTFRSNGFAPVPALPCSSICFNIPRAGHPNLSYSSTTTTDSGYFSKCRVTASRNILACVSRSRTT
mmetsp:Transcript_7549/g.30300  ORF Transcript_7549/g.30300 Transcript_7549/m.30300 type:complete len:272 (+) Transcript_7549:79-894(+)